MRGYKSRGNLWLIRETKKDKTRREKERSENIRQKTSKYCKVKKKRFQLKLRKEYVLLLKNHFSNHNSGAYCAAPYCGTRQLFPQDTVNNPGSPQDVLLILSSCRRFCHHGLIYLFGCLRLSPSLCYWQTTLQTYWSRTSSQETCNCHEMTLTQQHFVSKIYAFYVRITLKTTEEEGATSKRLVFYLF